MSYPQVTFEEIDNWFVYHAPTPDQVTTYAKLRSAGKELAKAINDLAPDSQEKWQAIMELRSVIMWANAAIACNSQESTDEH
jgi:hypothetical protein